MNKQREALELALEALEDYQTNGAPFFKCDSAVKAIREALAEPDQELEFWPGDVLICKEDDSKVTVVNGNRGSLQLMNGKIAIAWSDTVGGEYTIEQIKEMFYHAEKPEQDAPPARKPLTDYQIRQIDELVWKELTYEEKTFGQFALKMARAIERAHGIGEE